MNNAVLFVLMIAAGAAAMGVLLTGIALMAVVEELRRLTINVHVMPGYMFGSMVGGASGVFTVEVVDRRKP